MYGGGKGATERAYGLVWPFISEGSAWWLEWRRMGENAPLITPQMLRWVHPPNHLLRPSNQPKSQGCFFGIQHAWKTWIKSCLQRISCKIFSKLFFCLFLNICTIYILHWSDITLIIPELHRYQKLWIQQIGKYGKSFGSFQPEIWGHKEIPIFYNDLCLHKKWC